MGQYKFNALSCVIHVLAALLFAFCVVILLNFTAPNPTGRRYSSEIPLTTGQAPGGEIGADAERILAKDLGLPNNNDSGQRLCICNTTQYTANPPGQCNVCRAYSPRIGNFRIPDFMGVDYISESKNVRALSASDDNVFRQLRDMATVTEDAELAFWLFVRVDTRVDPEYLALFDLIKGGIVRYFAVLGYVDPVDQAARIGIALALFVLVAMWAWQWIRSRPPASPKPLRNATANPLRNATANPLRKAEDAHEFARRMQDRARGRIDKPNGKD